MAHDFAASIAGDSLRAVSEPQAGLAIATLTADRVGDAVGVLGRGMRDNPNNIAAFGPDANRRERCLRRLFAALFATMSSQQPLCALDGEAPRRRHGRRATRLMPTHIR